MELDIPSIVRPWHRLREPRFTGDELPLPDFGLMCPRCGEPLAGAIERACPHCACPFDPKALRPQKEWFRLDDRLCGHMPLQSVMTLLAREYVPHLTREQPAHGMLPHAEDLLVAGEFYFDVLWLLRRQSDRMGGRSGPVRRGSWSCRECAEQNPDTFEVCWNCNAARGE